MDLSHKNFFLNICFSCDLFFLYIFNINYYTFYILFIHVYYLEYQLFFLLRSLFIIYIYILSYLR